MFFPLLFWSQTEAWLVLVWLNILYLFTVNTIERMHTQMRLLGQWYKLSRFLESIRETQNVEPKLPLLVVLSPSLQISTLLFIWSANCSNPN